jgi:hypothetical protein
MDAYRDVPAASRSFLSQQCLRARANGLLFQQMLVRTIEDGENPLGPLATAPTHSTLTARSRSALPMTLTDDRAMAAAATTGDNSMPENGYRTPAASGMPATL